MALSVRFWGTRGSIPSPGPETVRHGGNTPCLELRTPDGWLVILDAGTGIRELGRKLVADTTGPDGSTGVIQGDIFLTHAHWDHIQGIPFFAPIFGRGHHFTIWGSSALEGSVERVVRDQMSPVVFPVTFEELDATIDFCELGEERREGRGYAVQAFPVRHPGGALGLRFSPAENGGTGANGGSLVYIPDNELGNGGRYDAPADWRERLVAFVRGAAVLVHDTMYTAEEYRRHGGWGHSTYDDAVQLALDAGVERLVLFHHKPERGDAELDVRAAECRALVARDGRPLEVIAAAEGMLLTV